MALRPERGAAVAVVVACLLAPSAAWAQEGGGDVIRRPEAETLALAASLGDLPAVQELLEKGASVDEPDAAGRTPLALAARWGRTEVVSALLEAGAAPDAADGEGRTPLHWAVAAAPGEAGIEIVTALLAAGAKLEAEDRRGRRPLHEAADRSSTAAPLMAELLLDAGATVDARDEDGVSPLLLAALAGRGDLARLLVQRGADPALAAERGPHAGLSALEVAGTRGDDALQAALAGSAVLAEPAEADG